MPADARPARRPVTVVTGFLGSGKTTLLARALGAPEMANTAVLVNEFGKVGLDHHLLRRADEKTVLLEHGCVCCTTRDDLVEALIGLLDEEDRGSIPPLDRVVVETTGLADPAPILYTVFSHPVLQHHYSVDLVVCTVDAINVRLHLEDNPESEKQVAAADTVVVTKTDLLEDGEPVRALIGTLRRINPSARVVEASFGELPPGELFRPPVGGHDFVVGSEAGRHVSATSSTSVTFDGPVDWTAFGIWLSMLLHARGESVLRVKGLLDVGESGPVVLNGVQHVMHPPRHLDAWPDEDRRSRVVFIARGISAEEILTSLEAFRPMIGAGPLPIETNAPV
jgi:G3E family GTPase